MRWVAFVGVALLLGSCSARDPYVTSRGDTVSGRWEIAHQVDRISGVELPSARVNAMASNTYIDYPKPALLQLTCFENKPLVRVSFDFKIGSDRNATMGYRFDDKPGRDNVESRILIGYQVIVIEDKAAVEQFVADLTGSRALYFRVRSLTAGRTTVEFPLEGSAAAMQAAFAGCPVTPLPGQKRTS